MILAALRAGNPLPKRIQDAPQLDLGLALYYLAFIELSSCRPLGFGGEGRIPWNFIEQYADAFGLEGDQRDDLFHHIREMDATYLRYQDSKRPKTGKGSIGRKGKR